VSKSWWIILTSFIVMVLSISGILELEFNSDFNRYFPHDDPEYRYFEKYLQKFQGEEEYVLVGLEFEDGLLNSANLNSIDQLTTTLKSLEAVTDVQSLSNAKYLIKSPMGMIPLPFTHKDRVELRNSDSIRIMKSPLLMNVLIDSSFHRTVLLLNINPSLDIIENAELGNRMQSLTQKVGAKNVYVAGRALSIAEISTRILREMVLFMILALFAISIILWRLYRRLIDIIFPVGVVVCAATILLGLMGFLGKSIDLMSSLLPAIMFVIGMADIIHINTHFRELIKKGKGKKASIRLAIKEVGLATFITSATTAIGFLTLLTSDIPSIRQFATFAASGIMIAFVLAITLFPAILYLIPAPDQQKLGQNTGRILPWMLAKTLKNRKAIVITSLLLLLACGLLIPNLRVDNYLNEDLPAEHPIRQSYRFMDTYFGGVRSLEMTISSDNNIFSQEVISQIDEIEQYLEKKYEASVLLSAPRIIKSINQAYAGGNSSQFIIPPPDLFKKLQVPIHKAIRSGTIDPIYHAPSNTARFYARVPDFGGKKYSQLNEEMMLHLTKTYPHLKFKLTGIPYLIDVNNQKMVLDMVLAIGAALLLVGILMGFLFKDPIIMISAFIANFLPLLLIVGVLVLFDIYINVPTAIIFTIAFGISVDDSIHFLSRIKVELQKGRSFLYAIKRSVLSTGKAVIYTSLIIFSGFGAMLFSDFTSTLRFGLLVSLCLVFALLADLILLPALLTLFHKGIKGS
jgi:predicted RND superfamily exporter protein